MSVAKAIADELSISPRTVARILSGDFKGNRPSMVRRVEAVNRLAEKYGYMRNTAAAALKSQRFDRISLVAGVQGSPFLPIRMLHGIESAAHSSGLALTYSELSDSELIGDELPRIFRELGSDGVLIHYRFGFPEEMLANFDKRGIPVVWVNNKFESNSVYIDEVGAGRSAVSHLRTQGHERIAYIGPDYERAYCIKDRRAGYREGMEEAGLQPMEFLRTTVVERCGPERIDLFEETLKENGAPTAFFAYCLYDAVPLLMAANRLGLRPMEDVAIVTIDDGDAGYVPYDLDALTTPSRALGQAAVKLLVDRIVAPDTDMPSRLVSYGPVARESTQPVA